MADTRTRSVPNLATFFAHTRPGRPVEEWEPLEQHLSNVARLAGDFAGEFGATDWGQLAGLWHDLGKYRGSFQRYLRKAGGASADGGCEESAPGRVGHSTVGAIHARQALGSQGKLAAYLIAGWLDWTDVLDATGLGANASADEQKQWG